LQIDAGQWFLGAAGIPDLDGQQISSEHVFAGLDEVYAGVGGNQVIEVVFMGWGAAEGYG